MEERKYLLEKLGGKLAPAVKKKKLPSGKTEEKVTEETVGGVLHWGRESSPDLEWFREKIREAYGGRAPRVLDPFAGGGAIPLEAMRLGCEVTAVDINPVAWFILKCTLEYPQKLAGQRRPLPKFAPESPEFMAGFLKDAGKLTRKQLERKLQFVQGRMFHLVDADLAWHVRAWGWWVLRRSKADLERFYPMVDGKPTVAYLWARTVTCKNCRATVPLLKTRWLCKKGDKRVLLTMKPNSDKTGVVFGIQVKVPLDGVNTAQRREHDKRIGAGTMSRSGVVCPCCGTIMAMEDLRLEGQAERLGTMMTAVVVDGPEGKEYRLPTIAEVRLATEAEKELNQVFAEIPFGLPEESLPQKEALGFRVPLYGFDKWRDLFIPRQLLALGVFAKNTRLARDAMQAEGYPSEWVEGMTAYLATSFSRLADYSSTICIWSLSEFLCHTFTRFALPMTWDFVEGNPIGLTSGNYEGAVDWVSRVLDHALLAATGTPSPGIKNISAAGANLEKLDVIVTDPPYYDAIPYSDLMDFFYIWLRRILNGLSPEFDASFGDQLAPKWDHDKNDGELIDDASRFGGDKVKSKAAYEEGMFQAFRTCYQALKPEGRLVVVFAHKDPDAWGTLVSAMIRAGFVVDASWPIQTEREARMRAYASAALSSSVWLVCKKRPESVRPGWDNLVLEEMVEKLHGRWDDSAKKWVVPPRLREYWDAGIRGPDFVWAATGPALEAYSKHPVVKKANEPGQLMTVSEFLHRVRRIVVDFVVGRVLPHNGDAGTASGLDDVTTYYLLHRYDFGMDNAPVGACILYAVSCGLSDNALMDHLDILVRTGGQTASEDIEGEDSANEGREGISEADDADLEEEGTGSTVKLKPWSQRKRKSMGYSTDGRQAPLIDQAHRLMYLWKTGDVVRVDEFLDVQGLRRNTLFHQLLQALIELAPAGSEERSLLESISNHVAARGVAGETAGELIKLGNL
ncbi:MAG: hypothetical protein M1379_12195 [Firmicutes bacterium]|nr:hypothetical protein [Bacillota bacterium]